MEIAVLQEMCWKSLGGKAKSKERVTTMKDGKIIKTVANRCNDSYVTKLF